MGAGPDHIDPTAYLDELLAQTSPDLMRQMLQDFINQILLHPSRQRLRG
ncbi:hypothetical protein CAURIS_11195 [Corynebacterium auris]|nr:hypothetical protein CAURIS_11195 [Corynebacterium auris]